MSTRIESEAPPQMAAAREPIARMAHDFREVLAPAGLRRFSAGRWVVAVSYGEPGSSVK
jgi:hypothetical protein